MIEGPALASLAELSGPYDLVFIDADKVGYDAYFEAVLPDAGPPRADRGGQHPPGRWRARQARTATRLRRPSRAFNDKLVNDPRVVCVLTTIRDGVTLIRRAG